MKIKRFIGKNKRNWFYGKGTFEEVETLNIEKNFDTALNVLHSIKKTEGYLFNKKDQSFVKRDIYGKRQAI